LLAWNIPPVWRTLDGAVEIAEGSKVWRGQRRLRDATRAALAAIAADVRAGLLETVGVGSSLVEDERASLLIELPPEADAATIAHAIDLENIEAWCDERGRVHVAVSPWYTTKDVDQTVLSVVKVVHVLLGLHATDAQAQPKGLWERMLASVMEIMLLEKHASQK
jgi:hypothetical protein